MGNVPFIPASDQNLNRVATALESIAGNHMIAETYDNTSTYEVGEHVRHEGLFYKCIVPITTAESWNAAHWQEVKVADELEAQNNNITKLREGVVIVVDGDTAAFAVPVGGYAYIRNNTHGLTDGMYKNTASSAFPISGGTADSTVFASVPDGAVNDAVSTFNNKFTPFTSDETKTLKTTWTMVKDITIPAKTAYGFEVRQYFSNVEPKGLAVSLDNTINAYSSMIVQDSNGSIISFTGYNPYSSPIHRYIFAKAGGSGSNGIIINGWFRSL